MTYRFLVILLIIVSSDSISSQDWATLPNQPEELGDVNWIRSYNKALQLGQLYDKPVFILFQEVPGCGTCKNYGNNVLTHPHIVEAIETYFIPLAIYNNKGGEDAKILSKFGEPSWNNPVSRIIDPSTEKDIVPRLNGKYDLNNLLSTISAGILASNKLIPEYLFLLQQEKSAQDLRETNLSMYCFWSGEKHLGEMEGVLSTRAGFMNGSEVVKVIYDANKITDQKLISEAAKKNCADGVYSNDQRQIKAAKKLKIRTKKEGSFRSDTQPKYYIHTSDYKYVPMTNLQSLKVNSALSKRQIPNRFLSPRQLEFFEATQQNPSLKTDAIDQDFSTTWKLNLPLLQKSE
ncbi:MAG: VPGUxxT family thioredoxin-like (seleno)protein, type 2 [Saprospiraceae bacterium]|nr:VPGUxxT family thioredoxin-like (seleno)protein, type 2 [Saprospiraceae bacterium]